MAKSRSTPASPRGLAAAMNWRGPLLAISLSLLACNVGPNFSLPEAEFDGRWIERSAVSSYSAKRPLDTAWWRSFKDPVLNRLIQQAYLNNLSLQTAGVRVLKARANLNQTVGEQFPQEQGLSGGVSTTQLPNSGYLGPSAVDMSQVVFASSWEIDFWGKYRRAIEGSQAGYLGSLAAYDDTLVTLISDVASVYIQLRTFETRRAIAQRNVANQKEALVIAEKRFELGETGKLDVSQSMTLMAETEAAVPQFELGMRQSKNALGLLLGTTPGQVDELVGGSRSIPSPPSSIAAGVPADLLRGRPDVRMAGLHAAARSAAIGVAESALYPSFSLAGSIGLRGTNINPTSASDLFTWNRTAASASGSFVMPIFNYGRIVNQVRIEDAAFQEAILNYQNTVLKAQREVSDGLVGIVKNRQTLGLVRNAVDSSKETTELAMIKYSEGETPFTTVLLALQSQLRVEDSEATYQGDVAQSTVSTYRALGGGWQIRGYNDVVSNSVKEEMARRTNWGELLKPEKHLPPPAMTESEEAP